MLVREQLKQEERFSDVESRIARYLLEREDGLRADSVRQIASRLYVAPSSIVRFCRKLGYEGFSDFKEAYLRELRYLSSHFQQIDPNFPFAPDDREVVVANKLAVLYGEIVRDCQTLLDPERLKQAVSMLTQAEAVYICTSGAQIGVAEVFRDKMMKIGRLVTLCRHTDEAYYHACYCPENCCFLIISYTGETDRAVKVSQKAKERGLPLLAITSYGNNLLSSLSDCCIYVSTREKLIKNLGIFGVNVSAMYLLDVLYANYFNQNYEKHYADKVKHSEGCERGGVRRAGRHSSNPILED